MTPDATSPSLHDLPAGSSFGSYRINRLLGRGGMGAVYEAVHQSDGRVVALKLLSVELDKMDSRERFLREGRTAAAINHPNAVYIYGTEEIGGTPVISMELVPGGTLEEKVQKRGPLPAEEAVEDILQVIDGLAAALAAGVLHRDVKPANCFVNASGVVKIGDFGLSKPVDGEEQQKLTRTGVFLGTPVFSSPEQLLGETLDVRSDIYAVGVTLYYLLTGALPYTSGSMMQVVAAVLNGSPAPLTSHRADLPAAVQAVVLKAIARKTADRYQNYDEFRTAVVALRKPETKPATPWDRVRAGFVDLVAVGFTVWLLTLLTLSITGKNWTSASPEGLKLNFALGLAVSILALGIPEGLRGLTLGKFLVGIRVTNVGGAIPGLARGLARLAVFQLIDFAALFSQIAPASLNARAWLAFAANFGLRALLLVTMRRSNGWLMLQDWLTGTRVVRPQASAHTRHESEQQRLAPVVTGAERRVGSYAVLGPSGEGNPALLGWDASMQRSVWIVPQEAGAPEIPQARRDLARLTRLRWVAGCRAAGENWDAYEAANGESLAARLARPAAWKTEQEWLLDLSAELVDAEHDGTLPRDLSIESIWVTPSDRLVLLESGGGGAPRADGAVGLIGSVIDALRDANRKNPPLPRHAAVALDAARTAQSAEEVAGLFKTTIGRPAEISRARRAGLVAATIGTVLFVPVLAIVPIQQQAKSDPQGRTLSGLLQFIGDSSHARPAAERPKRRKGTGNLMTRFNEALMKAGWFPSDSALNRLSPEQYREQSRLAQVYVAATLAPRIRDSLSTSVFGRSPPERRLAKDILKNIPSVDSAELRAARMLVDSTWQGNPPGTSVDLLLRVIGAILFVFFPWGVAGCSIVIALIARRGPLMRGFQLDVVTKNGEPAGRLRILLRNLVTWSPLTAPILIYFAIEAATPASAGLAMKAAEIVIAVIFSIAVWMTVRSPGRGIADRIAGTFLVPE